MKLVLLGLFTVFIQGCSVFSLHPLYEVDNLIFDELLLGEWRDTDGDEWIILEKEEDNFYKLTYFEVSNPPDETDTLVYEVGLLKLDKNLFMDLYPYLEKQDHVPDEVDYLFRNFIPVHSFLKIEKEKDRMLIYMFDGERMINLFEQNRIRIKHEMMDDYIVITASTPDLQKFIRKYSDDEKAFDDPGIFERIR